MAKRRASYGAKKRRVRRRVSMRSRPSKFIRRRMRYRGSVRRAYIRVKRMTCASQLCEFSTTGTANFWRYVTPSLTTGFTDFKSGSSVGGFNNLTEFENLFDQYRLHGIKYEFRPRALNLNTTQNSTAVVNYTPNYIVLHKDPSSQISPTGVFDRTRLNVLLESGGKIYRADRKLSFYFRPWMEQSSGTVGNSTRLVKPRWIDLDATGKTQSFNGFHMFAYNQNFDSAQLDQVKYDLTMTYYVSFRNLK